MSSKHLILICFLFLLACTGSKYTPLDYPEDAIYFGYSGGIANMTTEYCLLENGHLFQKGDEASYTTVKRIDSRQSEQLFNNITFLDLKSMDVKDPGNKTNFIRLKSDSGIKELAWGGNRIEPTKELALFYSALMNLVKKEN